MKIADVKFIFSKCELCKIRILFELRLGAESGRGRFTWVHNGAQWFVNRVAHVVLEFLVALAMQWKQHQCHNYCVCCQSLLSENSGQISIRDLNTEYMQIEFKF